MGEGPAPLTPGARGRRQPVPGWCHTVLALGISARVLEGLEWVPEMGCRGAESTEATACHCLPRPRPLPKSVWFVFSLFSAVWFGKLGEGVPISRRLGSLLLLFGATFVFQQKKERRGKCNSGRREGCGLGGRLVLLCPR